MLRDLTCADVTFVVQGEYIHAHKVLTPEPTFIELLKQKILLKIVSAQQISAGSKPLSVHERWFYGW